MVLKVRISERVYGRPFLERYVAKCFGIKPMRLERYMGIEEAAALLGKTQNQLFKTLLPGKKVKMVDINGTFILLKEHVIQMLATKMRSRITRELKKVRPEEIN